MDTSNSAPAVDMNFKVSDLHPQMPGENDLAVRAYATIEALTRELRPVLKFVASLKDFTSGLEGATCEARVTVHCALVLVEEYANLALYIDWEGNFFKASRCTKGDKTHWHLAGPPANDRNWITFNFCNVLKGIQRLLTEAKARHDSHSRLIDARLKKLDEIMAVLKK